MHKAQGILVILLQVSKNELFPSYLKSGLLLARDNRCDDDDDEPGPGSGYTRQAPQARCFSLPCTAASRFSSRAVETVAADMVSVSRLGFCAKICRSPQAEIRLLQGKCMVFSPTKRMARARPASVTSG